MHPRHHRAIFVRLGFQASTLRIGEGVMYTQSLHQLSKFVVTGFPEILNHGYDSTHITRLRVANGTAIRVFPNIIWELSAAGVFDALRPYR